MANNFSSLLKKVNLNIYSRFCFLTVSFLFSILFTYYYFLYTNEYPPGSYTKIANYEADKVFQTRILVTVTANLMEPTIPLLQFFFQWAIPYPINYEVLLQIITIFSIVFLLLSIPHLLNILSFGTSKWVSLLILFPLFWNYVVINGMIDGAGLYYPYDIPSLTFFSIGVILFYKRKWLLFYPLFILALLNRESSCFISLAGFFLIIPNFNIGSFSWYKKNFTIISHVLIQALLWLSSRIILSWYFRDNPGLFFEEPHSMFDFCMAIFKGQSHWAMYNPRWFLTIFVGFWIFPLLFFKKMNTLECRFLLVGLIYIISLLFRSNMMEVRVYNELNIILFAVTVSFISRVYRNPLTC